MLCGFFHPIGFRPIKRKTCGSWQKQQRNNESISDELFFDEQLNFDETFNCYYLLYSADRLLSFLIVFAPTAEEAEITAFTHPQHRQKGYFRMLFERMREELDAYEIGKILFVCDHCARDAKQMLRALGAEFSHSEYYMQFDPASEAKQAVSQAHLIEAGEMHLEEMIELDRQIFNESPDATAKMIESSVRNEEISTYLLMLDETMIGMCSVWKKERTLSVFGLGNPSPLSESGIRQRNDAPVAGQLRMIRDFRIVIEVETGNERALKLYSSEGFRIAVQYDYYRLRLAE
jgi:GNAT superfamily N-acetyltransferase